jgi:co-chaperonin GroES (HSP10)
MEEQTPHSHRLTRENNGLAEIDQYKNCPLPEDYEITELLGDTLQIVYLDVDPADGRSLVRNGIVIPDSVAEQKAWRVGEVILAGPGTRQVKKGHFVIFPGDKGLPAINKDGRMSRFLDEERIFGICSPVQ